MRVHYLQHVPFEGLGSIETWLRAANCQITSTYLYDSAVFPNIGDFDLLIIMGGSMSVNDESRFPWLANEKQFIQTAIEADKAVLGICLGAQLIASSVGARVLPNEHKEIGWFPVDGTSPSSADVFQFPHELEVFHWHGETFELPDGAIRLARNNVCENQGFQLGRNVIGLQFHLETTPASAREIVANCSEELIPASYVQTEGRILDATSSQYATINAVMGDVLNYLHRA